jgi:leucine dehydrogenase
MLGPHDGIQIAGPTLMSEPTSSSVFESVDFDDHEHVSFFCDAKSGLRAIIAIHSTGSLGGAGGGCRMWPYPSDAAALADALRLSRAMSYKLALFGVPSGGAKAVVIGDPRSDKTEALLRALGRAVDRLGGRFVIGEDVGTTEDDMQILRKETPFVMAGQRSTAPETALGVFLGLRAAVGRRLGRSGLDGVSVAVQGAGHVGARLCELLAEAGARLTVTDVDPAARERVRSATGAVVVEPEAIYDVEADVLAPCALGAILDDGTIARLRCAVVAGSANNQLARDAHADALAKRGILYAPDFVLNAGGVLGGRDAALGVDAAPDRAEAERRLAPIAETLEQVFARADREGVTPHAAAVAMATEALGRA